jgi:hypothetical protein
MTCGAIATMPTSSFETDSLMNCPVTSRRVAVRAAITAALLTLAVAGCGTGEYHKRMKDRLAELKQQSRFLERLDDIEIDVSDPQAIFLGVKLRPPKNICTQGKALRVGYTEDNVEIDERRVKPPFLLGMRDFCLSYELLVPNPDTRNRQQTELPVYCYFAVSPADSVEQQALLNEIRQPLAENFEDVPEEWETVSPGAPDGGSVEWKRLRVEGSQLFDCVPNPAMMDGRFDVYVHSDNTYHVVVGWRAPVSVDDKLEFMQAGEVSLGTLKVEPPEASPEAAEPSDDSSVGR